MQQEQETNLKEIELHHRMFGSIILIQVSCHGIQFIVDQSWIRVRLKWSHMPNIPPILIWSLPTKSYTQCAESLKQLQMQYITSNPTPKCAAKGYFMRKHVVFTQKFENAYLHYSYCWYRQVYIAPMTIGQLFQHFM